MQQQERPGLVGLLTSYIPSSLSRVSTSGGLTNSSPSYL